MKEISSWPQCVNTYSSTLIEYQQSMTQFNNHLLTVKGHIDGSMQKKYNQCEYTGAMPPSHQAIDVRITEMFLIFIIQSQHCGCWWSVALLFQERPTTVTVRVSIDFLDINRIESTVYKQIRYK